MNKSTLSWRSRGVVSLLGLGLALFIGLVIVAAPTTAQSTKPGGAPAARAEVTNGVVSYNLVHFLKTCCVRAFAGSATLRRGF